MMSNELNIFLILLSAMLVNNILLIRFIALCSFFGISNSIKTSVGMGMAVIFVMVMATAVSWPVYHYLLVPFDLDVPAHRGVHPDDRHVRAARGDVHPQGVPAAVPGHGDLPAADRRQLRRAGGGVPLH